MGIFHEHISQVEKESNSVLEVLEIVDKILKSLGERYNDRFLPLIVKSALSKLRKEGHDKECDNFEEQVFNVYKKTEEYIQKWTKSRSELRVFEWLNFKAHQKVEYSSVEDCVIYLQTKNVCVDDSKLHDQVINLNEFLKTKENQFFQQSSSSKICAFFSVNNITTFTEILRIAQFFFAIPGHNANCERIFSLMGAQWSKERNLLDVATVRDILIVQFNFKKLSCMDFVKYLQRPENKNLVKKIGSSEKYH